MLQEMAYIYEVYRERSFSKAAKNLYISQPALSAYVKKVEEQVGLKLFNRNVTPIELTEAGRAYIETAKRILSSEQDLTRFLNDLSEMRAGSLTLGGTHFYSAHLLPPIIKEFQRKYPGIQVKVVEGDSISLYDRMEEHPDLILDGGTAKEAAYETAPFFEETVLLCVPKECALNEGLAEYQLTAAEIRRGRHKEPGMPPVPLRRFAEEPFVLMKPGHDLYHRGMELCQGAGFTPHSSMHLSQMMTAYSFSLQGLGVTFVTDLLVHMQEEDTPMVFYRLGHPRAKRPAFLAYRKGTYMTRAMTAFIGLTRAMYSPNED